MFVYFYITAGAECALFDAVWRSRYLSKNESVLAPHINLSVGSACHSALCSINEATKAHMAAVRRLHIICYIDTFVGAMSEFHIKDKKDHGKRSCISNYNNKASNSFPLQAALCKYL